MEIDIPMKRFKVKEILVTYTSDFLEKHNLFNTTVILGTLSFTNISFTAIAKTKYGYIAVDEQDYITYVGDGVWSVTRNEKRGH